MNRNSPVPLWAVLGVGVVLVGGAYVAARIISAQQVGVPILEPKVLARRTPCISPQPTISSILPSASPSTATLNSHVVPIGWKTYHNSKYRFEIFVPSNWSTYVRGEGEYGAASGDESRFLISNGLPEAGFSVTIYALGSDALGPYRSATSVQAYVQLLRNASATSSDFAASATDLDIAERPSLWFRVCSPYAECFLDGFFQNGRQVFEISIPTQLNFGTVATILSTWRFL
jgi:hypothetical protein